MKLSSYIPYCPTCSQQVSFNGRTVSLNVRIEYTIQKDFIFCSKKCFNDKIDYIRSSVLGDGIGMATATFKNIRKISDIPEKWELILEGHDNLKVEML